MECKWPTASSRMRQRRQSSAVLAPSGSQAVPCMSPGESLGAEQAVDQMFDYASFMWDGADMWPASTDFGVVSTLQPPTVVSPMRALLSTTVYGVSWRRLLTLPSPRPTPSRALLSCPIGPQTAASPKGGWW